MMLQLADAMARRRRSYSLKDLVVILAASAVIFVVQYLLKKFAPGIPDKARSTISSICGIVVIIIGVFCFRT